MFHYVVLCSEPAVAVLHCKKKCFLQNKYGMHQYDVPAMMPANTTVLVVGPRNCGKTVMMQHMLHSVMEKLDEVHVFAQDRDTLEEYEEGLPGCNAHRTLCPKYLKSILDVQEMQSGKRALGIVLDDCLGCIAEFNSEIRRLITNGKELNVFVLIGLSYYKAVPKELLPQMDVVAIFPETDVKTLHPLWKAWLKDTFLSKEECLLTFSALPAHTALILDLNKHGSTYTAQICKASVHPTPPRDDAPDVDFGVTRETEVRKTVTVTVDFDPPVHVDWHIVDAADGRLTFFAKHDIFREFLRSGTRDVLIRRQVPEEVRKCTGLVFGYKAVSNAANVSWASENMLQKIFISEAQ
jgi:GTPase SAR1 family protein